MSSAPIPSGEVTEQIGWFDPKERRLYFRDTDWRCFAHGKRPDRFVPVYIKASGEVTACTT